MAEARAQQQSGASRGHGEVANDLRTFIISELPWKVDADDLTDDYPLIDNGVVDSLGLLMLVNFIEDRFGVELAYEELLPANFGSIGALAQMIERKRSAVR